MKNILKQLGKALCYYGLFLGMQLVVMYVYSFLYSFMLGMQIAAGGEAFDAAAMAEKISQHILEQLNMLTIISGCLTLVILWIFFLIRKKKLSREVNIAPVSGKTVPCIIVLGIALALTISTALCFLPESWVEAYAEQSQYTLGGLGIVTIISNMIVAPIVEEVIVRGLMLSRLKKAMPVAWAVAISSVLFGLAHGQILWICYATLLGVVLAVVALKTESLVGSILLHMTINIFGTVIPMACSGITSVAAIAVMAAAGAVISVLMLIVLFKLTNKRVTE